MICNVLEYLENSTEKYPNKVAFEDEKYRLTYQETMEKSRRIGSYLSIHTNPNQPIAIYMEKSVYCLTAYWGAVYAGCYYVPIDSDMPISRVQNILDTLKPAYVICDEKNRINLDSIGSEYPYILFNEVIRTTVNEQILINIRRNIIDTDLLYVLFTSGSTGSPKGVTISHKSVIDYTEWVVETLMIDDSVRFGNQAPFYFDNSVLDIYATLSTSAYLYIIPKICFSFPKKMIKLLNEQKINTIFWVPFALISLANSGILTNHKIEYLNNIFFCGEVMPCKQLNIWIEYLPNAKYCNMYGPTEITDVCTYYIIDREFADDDILPIGRPCKNTRILILNENNRLCKVEEQGELCVTGTGLSFGYYGNQKKSDEVFVQNPLNTLFIEKIYRTGDLAKFRENGEIIFMGRKDFQIKHRGNRIELGEIETALLSVSKVNSGCCQYDSENGKIVCFYCGDLSDKELISQMKTKISKYMLPNVVIHLETMPQTLNGKIDRVILKEKYLIPQL